MDQPITLDTLVRFLVSAPLFEGLDAVERTDIVRIMEVARLADGEEAFREGEAGDAWYVIFEGQAEVAKSAPGGRGRRVALLEAGACFGEMAILDGSARSATVRAVGPLTVLRFRRATFQELIDEGSLAAYKLVLAMARSLSLRQRKLTQQLSGLLEQGESTVSSVAAVRAELGGLVDGFQVSQ